MQRQDNEWTRNFSCFLIIAVAGAQDKLQTPQQQSLGSMSSGRAHVKLLID